MTSLDKIKDKFAGWVQSIIERDIEGGKERTSRTGIEIEFEYLMASLCFILIIVFCFIYLIRGDQIMGALLQVSVGAFFGSLPAAAKENMKRGSKKRDNEKKISPEI